jgi:hypothetical protein
MLQFIIFLLINTSSAFGENAECSIDAKNCVFTGSLETHTYPGEPNYKDIKTGDEAETHLYLKLDSPILIRFKEWDKDQSPSAENVTLLQIGGDFNRRFFKVAKKPNHIVINGTLFEAFSGHHHTHFLIDPVKINQGNK